MSTILLPEDTYRRKFLVPAISDTPAAPEITDINWGQMVTAALRTYSSLFTMSNGQLLIGFSGAAALANPSVAPNATDSSSGAIPDGSYYIKYSFTNNVGETLTSTAFTLVLTGGTNSFTTDAITMPTGATGVNWYMSIASLSPTLRLFKSNTGLSFNQTSLPLTLDKAEPTVNTTASSSHPEKGLITGGGGLTVTNGPGSINIVFNPTADTDNNGFAFKQLKIENFTTGTLPVLTTGDKGRLAFNTTIGSLVVWNGTTWLGLLTGAVSTTVGGDLSGSLPNPVVVRLQGRTVASTAPTDGQFLMYSLANSRWQPASPTISANATSLRGQPIATTTPTTGQALIFNGTSYAPTTIISTSGNATSLGSIPLSGVAPTTGQVLVFDGTVYQPQDVVAATGNANTLAGTPVNSATPNAGDLFIFDGTEWGPGGVPAATSSLTGGLRLTGDLGGTATAPLVVGIQNRPVASTAPANGDVLGYNGTTWLPVAGGGGGGGGGDATSIQTIPVNALTPTNGDVLTVVSGEWVPQAPSGGGGSGDATTIQTIPVDPTTPTTGQVLAYNGTSYVPTDISTTDGSILYTKVGRTTNLSIPDSTDAVFQFDNLVSNQGTALYNGTDSLQNTSGATGTFVVIVGIAFDINATGYREVRIAGGGSTTDALIRTLPNNATTDMLNLSAVVTLNDTDTVTITVYQSSGGALDTMDISYALMYQIIPAGGGVAIGSNATQLQGNNVNALTPSENDVLKYVSGEWTPATISSGGAINYAINSCLAISQRFNAIRFGNETGFYKLAPGWRFWKGSGDSVTNTFPYDGGSLTQASSSDDSGTLSMSSIYPTFIENYLILHHRNTPSAKQLWFSIDTVGVLLNDSLTVSFYASGYQDLGLGAGEEDLPVTLSVTGCTGGVNLTIPKYSSVANHRISATFTFSSNQYTNAFVRDGFLYGVIDFPTDAVVDLGIVGVQVELGTILTDFKRNTYSSEQYACGRLYQNSLDFSLPLPYMDSTGCFTFTATRAGAVSQVASSSVVLPVKMWTIPTISFLNAHDHTNNMEVYNVTTDEFMTDTTAIRVGRSGFTIQFTGSAATSIGDEMIVNWVADTEIGFDAPYQTGF